MFPRQTSLQLGWSEDTKHYLDSSQWNFEFLPHCLAFLYHSEYLLMRKDPAGIIWAQLLLTRKETASELLEVAWEAGRIWFGTGYDADGSKDPD